MESFIKWFLQPIGLQTDEQHRMSTVLMRFIGNIIRDIITIAFMMLLWNWFLVPTITVFKNVNFWQMWGIIAFFRTLFLISPKYFKDER